MPLLVPKNAFIFVYTCWQDVFALLAFKKTCFSKCYGYSDFIHCVSWSSSVQTNL